MIENTGGKPVEPINEIITSMEGASNWIAVPLWVLLVYLVFSKLFGEEETRGALRGIGRVVSRNRRRMIALDRREEVEREIARLGENLKAAKTLNNEYEATINHQHRYILYITGEVRRLELWASEQGITLPPPPIHNYTKWSKIENSS